MTLQISVELLGNSSGELCIDFISNNYEKFIWDEYGDEIVQWESIAKQRSLPLIKVETRDDGAKYYHYKEKSVLVPIFNDRDDNIISVYNIGNLVYPDLELRMTVDTVGNSERAFLPLTPEEWEILENEYGASLVESRFTRLGNSIKDMFKRAQHAYDLRYPEDIDVLTSPSAGPYKALMKEIPSNWQHAAEYVNLQNIDGTLRVDRFDYLVQGFLENTINVFFAKGFIGQEKDGVGISLQKSLVLAEIFSRIGDGDFICLFNDARTRVVVIYCNYTACIWLKPLN